jgi:hypothetical protein
MNNHQEEQAGSPPHVDGVSVPPFVYCLSQSRGGGVSSSSGAGELCPAREHPTDVSVDSGPASINAFLKLGVVVGFCV